MELFENKRVIDFPRFAQSRLHKFILPVLDETSFYRDYSPINKQTEDYYRKLWIFKQILLRKPATPSNNVPEPIHNLIEGLLHKYPTQRLSIEDVLNDPFVQEHILPYLQEWETKFRNIPDHQGTELIKNIWELIRKASLEPIDLEENLICS